MDNDELLIEVYKAFYGPNITLANLNDLARDLSQVARRSRPWTGKFLHSLIKGYAGFSTNQELINALHILVGRLEGSDEIQQRAKEATILTVNDLPEGTIVLGPARRCATPGCRVFFVPVQVLRTISNSLTTIYVPDLATGAIREAASHSLSHTGGSDLVGQSNISLLLKSARPPCWGPYLSERGLILPSETPPHFRLCS